MLKIFLLRHGETAWNADNNRYCGRSDIPLTEKGIRQAEEVKKQMKGIELTKVFSSPLQRAFTTARIASGREPIKDDRLTEADFGAWEGKTKEEFIAENESLWLDWMSDPAIHRAGGSGETGAQIVARVSDFSVPCNIPVTKEISWWWGTTALTACTWQASWVCH